MDALEALTRRVSGSKLVEPAPDELEVHSLLAAATRAPDHGRLRPWRFVVLRGEAIKRFGELMATTMLRRKPDTAPEKLDKEREKPLRAPLVLVVAAKVDPTSKIPVIEQVMSAAAAAQNVMVGAYAMGYGCAWKTGDAAYDDDVKAAFGLAPEDAIVGFMYLGSYSSPPPPAPELDIETYVIDWPGAA